MPWRSMRERARAVRLTARTLRDAVRVLCTGDHTLTQIVVRYGLPPFDMRDEGFVTLARMILEQQVSLESATTLFRRVDGEMPGGFQPQSVIAVGVDGLRARGLTRQKASYVVALAERVLDGRLDLTRLAQHSDDHALAELQQVPGIGPWTAQVYLLFALGRPDAWPHGDLALHIALQQAHGLAERPTSHVATQIAQRWAPYRAVAARILWHGYLRERGRTWP